MTVNSEIEQKRNLCAGVKSTEEHPGLWLPECTPGLSRKMQNVRSNECIASMNE